MFAGILEHLKNSPLDEEFRDVFKPISDRDLKKRIPKPKEKKGDNVGWGRYNSKYKDIVLLKDPKLSRDDVYWHSSIRDVDGKIKTVYFDDEYDPPNGGGWFAPLEKFESISMIELVDEEFEDIFQPASAEELANRWKHIPKFLLDLKPNDFLNINKHIDWLYYPVSMYNKIKDVLEKEVGRGVQGGIFGSLQYPWVDGARIVLSKKVMKDDTVGVKYIKSGAPKYS